MREKEGEQNIVYDKERKLRKRNAVDHFVSFLLCLYECMRAAGGRRAVRAEKLFPESGGSHICGGCSV